MKKKLHIKEKYRRFKAWVEHIISSCAKFCREKLDLFKAWREQPRQIAPITQEEHECLNCHDHYTGRFCPRCGQAATTNRFSMKVAAANFAEAYGMGERGMFRTMRDLILRPGYLILDYLRGMRVSYFAPFKMFFLLFALSVLVTHGLNIKGQRVYDDEDTEFSIQDMNDDNATETDVLVLNNKTFQVSEHAKNLLNNIINKLQYFQKRFPSIFLLLMLMFLSGILFIFFRHCPKIPDLRYSEFFISLIYITNMYTIYSIVFDFFCLTKLSSLSILLTLIPLKQMSGYSWRRTILKSVAAVTIMFIALVAFIVLAMLGIFLFVK